MTLDVTDILPIASRVAGIVAQSIKANARDAREPGRKRKTEREKKLERVVSAYLRRLAEKVQATLETLPQSVKAQPDLFDDDYLDDPEFDTELYLALLDAAKDGAQLAGERTKIAIDYNLTNTEAAQWVSKYVTPFMKDLNQATRDNINAVVKEFIETPGMTVGDAMRALNIADPVRAQRISTTEITRAYAQGTLEHGQQLKEDFPDMRVTKKWYTDEDNLVCEICGELDGKEVEVDEEFSDGIDGPPAHVNCRCSIDTGIRI